MGKKDIDYTTGGGDILKKNVEKYLAKVKKKYFLKANCCTKGYS